MDGLQQNEENRSNPALFNTGEVDGSDSVFHLEIYDGETGMLVETVVTRPIPARRWHQINGVLGSYAPETRQGYIHFLKVSGRNPFLAYAVVNDGGVPGQPSGDGAHFPARELGATMVPGSLAPRPLNRNLSEWSHPPCGRSCQVLLGLMSPTRLCASSRGPCWESRSVTPISRS